ncbi:MAG: SDR family NAD(P)-dependent oxidoreductase [Saprospiraceae bacterium]|nr:SDR family NAD(P)-dependent oxidoreductase [Saprospiraceae bacterium]
MKNIIITGANGSLGLWISKYLHDKGYHIIMACRNIQKAAQDIEMFKHLPKNANYTLKSLDLSDFESIRHFVNDLETTEIYGLVCNAGMSYSGEIRYSKQGIEEMFCSNYLGHFLLTNLLIAKMKIERLLFISSALHDPAIKSPFASAVFKSVKEMAYPDTKNLTDKSFQEFYATAKLCEIMFAYELDRRLNARQKRHYINVFNPGLMALTNFGRNRNSFSEKMGRYLLHFIGRLFGFGTSARVSGRYAAQHLTETKESRKYFDKEKFISSSKDSYDIQNAKLLWDESNEILKDYR